MITLCLFVGESIITKIRLLFQNIWKFFSSLKLGIVLLSVLAASVIPAALLLQNQPPEYYMSAFPRPIALLIFATGYYRFFTSPFFLLLVAFFWLNLLSCAIKRFISQMKTKGRKRFGPDILHAGLLLLIIGGTVTAFDRQEGMAYLSPEEAFRMPNGAIVVVTDIEYETYDSVISKSETDMVTHKRPRQWITTGYIEFPGKTAVPFMCSVNHPFRFDGFTLYQADFREMENGVYQTGIKVVRDRGVYIVFSSFILICIGLFLTYIGPGRKRI